MVTMLEPTHPRYNLMIDVMDYIRRRSERLLEYITIPRALALLESLMDTKYFYDAILTDLSAAYVKDIPLDDFKNLKDALHHHSVGYYDPKYADSLCIARLLNCLTRPHGEKLPRVVSVELNDLEW